MSTHNIDETDVAQLASDFFATAPTTTTAVGSAGAAESAVSASSLLDLALQEEDPQPPQPPLPITGGSAPAGDRGAAGGGGGGDRRQIRGRDASPANPRQLASTFGKNISDAFKKGIARSRSPSHAREPSIDAAAIPFSSGSSSTTDFYAAISGPSRTSAAPNSPTSVPHHHLQQPSSPGGSSPGRLSLEQRLNQTQQRRTSSPNTSLNLVTPTSVNSAVHDFTPAGQARGNIGGSMEAINSSYPPLPPANSSASYIIDSRIPTVNVVLDAHQLALPTARWTDPSTFHEIPHIDAVSDAITKLYVSGSPTSSTSASMDSLSKPLRVLMSIEEAEARFGPDGAIDALIQNHSFRALATLCRNRLIKLGATPQDVDAICKYWVLRLQALERLRLTDLLILELETILPQEEGDPEDRPDLQFESHPEVFIGRSGPMVSHDLRILWARSPTLKNNHNDAISRLSGILISERRRLNRENDPAGKAALQSRIINTHCVLVAVLMEARDFRLAVEVVESLVRSFPTNITALSISGRLHLQLGDVILAGQRFLTIEQRLIEAADRSGHPAEVITHPEHAPVTPGFPVSIDLAGVPRPDLILSHRAFLALAEGDAHTAAHYLSTLTIRDPNDIAAINNLSVCHLYVGNLASAISFLESCVVEIPQASRMANVIFNLATLFDLGDRSTESKRRMIGGPLASRGGDDIDPACLKV